MALLNKTILNCIAEGLKGNYLENDDSKEYACGWWPNGYGHTFEAESSKLDVCCIHWFGKGSPDNFVDIESGDKMFFIQNIADMEVKDNKLIVTEQGGAKTEIQ